MAEILCRNCYHSAPNRKQGIYIRCTKYSKWVPPNGTCENAEDEFFKEDLKDFLYSIPANAEINENIIVSKELARKAPESSFIKKLVLGKNKRNNK